MCVRGASGPGAVVGRVMAAVLCFLMPAVMSPVDACASCPVPGGPVVALGFHESYPASDRAVTHLGVDLSADGGSPVSAPCDGTVSFVGDVPASEPGDGRTMRAVSLLREDGRTLTMMPFEAVSVEEGQQVHDGMLVGTLAGGGDRSVPVPHLHVGLKEDSRYFDPLPLLGMAGDAPSRGSEPDCQGAMAGAAEMRMEEDALAVQDAWQVMPDSVSDGLDAVLTDDVPAGYLVLPQDQPDELSPDATVSADSGCGVAVSSGPGQVPVTSAGARLDTMPSRTVPWHERVWSAVTDHLGSVIGNMVDLLACELGLGHRALVAGAVAAILVLLVPGLAILAAFWCRCHLERRPARCGCRSARVSGMSTTGRGEGKTKRFALSAGQ